MEILTVQGAADLLEVDARTVYRLIERDGLPAFKVGRQWRMRVSDLDTWIDDQVRVREPAGTYGLTQQPLLSDPAEDAAQSKPGFSDSAFTENGDLPVHSWVPWIAGFSATFVADVFDHYLGDGTEWTVMDPFAGVGTTLVVSLLRGYSTYGFEINPYAARAARLKLSVRQLPADLLEGAIEEFRTKVGEAVRSGAEPASSAPAGFRTRRPFLSPEVERKVLLARDFILGLADGQVGAFFSIALASELVGFSNYSYEPSLGTRAAAGKRDILDAPVVSTLTKKLRRMLADVRLIQQDASGGNTAPPVGFFEGNLFDLDANVPDGAVDLVVTSPPYVNNYHYIRNSRPQVYWLDLVSSPGDLKGVEEGSFGKYWQTVRGREAVPLTFELPDLRESIDFLRTINTHKGEYGGHGWANYAATYFNDCHRFAGVLARVLRPGGRAVVVLGNSILQGVEFPTDTLFGRICELRGLVLDDVVPLRDKRTGNSIIKSSVRANAAKAKTRLYETAVVVRRRA